MCYNDIKVARHDLNQSKQIKKPLETLLEIE